MLKQMLLQNWLVVMSLGLVLIFSLLTLLASIAPNLSTSLALVVFTMAKTIEAMKASSSLTHPE
jgi:hypothetical protein